MTRFALALGIVLTSAAVAAAQGATPPQTTPPPVPSKVEGQTTPPPQTAKPPQTTRKPAPRTTSRGGNVTLAINVIDPEGNGVPNVSIKIEGATSRTARTEGGRIALEGLPAGTYNLRFDREGFIPLEKEFSARAGQVVDVKVTLTPLPPPPAPPEPPPAPPKPVGTTGKSAAADIPGVIETEYIGRAAQRINPVSCSGDVESTVIQLNQPLAQHTHDDADEIYYVIAGEGSADVGGRQQKLKAGIYLFIPRGTPHGLTKSGGKPLIVLSSRSGAPCK